MKQGIDITKGIKIIEMLKCELLENVSLVFRIMNQAIEEESKEKIKLTLSDIILISYILSRRLGLDFEVIDKEIDRKIKLGLINENEIEKYFGDLSELAQHRNRN